LDPAAGYPEVKNEGIFTVALDDMVELKVESVTEEWRLKGIRGTRMPVHTEGGSDGHY
jgi:hypothetical protein